MCNPTFALSDNDNKNFIKSDSGSSALSLQFCFVYAVTVTLRDMLSKGVVWVSSGSATHVHNETVCVIYPRLISKFLGNQLRDVSVSDCESE